MRAIARTGVAIHTLPARWNALPENFADVAEARALGTRILHFCGSRRVPETLRSVPRESANTSRRRSPRRKRLRVLIVTNTLFPRVGGQEAFIERLTEHLAALCEVGLATRAGLWYPGDANIARFSIVDPPQQDPRRRWRALCASLRRITARFQPDIVHFGSARESIYRWAIPRTIPAVATVHGNDLTGVSAAHNDSGREPSPLIDSLNACRRIFPTGRYTESLARAWGVRARTVIQTPGCDTELFRPRPTLGAHTRATLGIAPEMPIILTVARLVPRKCHLNVLHAIEGLPFPVRWVVVGDGPCREQIVQAVGDRGMRDSVLLLGSVADDELVGLYNACDVFVMTPEERGSEDGLDSEGFGLVFHEAGACGKPVVASDVSGCRDSVGDGRTGFLVNPGDATALRQTLEFLLTHPQEAEALGACGLESVRALGGWPRLARALLREYQGIARRARVTEERRSGARHGQ
jgi:phosphatidylinositol alpha-1,6-mannosyltransferase